MQPHLLRDNRAHLYKEVAVEIERGRQPVRALALGQREAVLSRKEQRIEEQCLPACERGACEGRQQIGWWVACKVGSSGEGR